MRVDGNGGGGDQIRLNDAKEADKQVRLNFEVALDIRSRGVAMMLDLGAREADEIPNSDVRQELLSQNLPELTPNPPHSESQRFQSFNLIVYI